MNQASIWINFKYTQIIRGERLPLLKKSITFVSLLKERNLILNLKINYRD